MEDCIARICDLDFLKPKGMFDVIIKESSLSVYDSDQKRIVMDLDYTNIIMMYLLPHETHDQKHMVIALSKGVTENGGRFLRIVLRVRDECEVKVHLEKLRNVSHLERSGIRKKMRGRKYETLGKLVRGFSGKKLIGQGIFRKIVPAEFKIQHESNLGHIYFLNRSMFFLNSEKTFYLRYENITSGKFDNDPIGNNQFKIDILVRGTSSKKTTVEFSKIDLRFYQDIKNLVRSKKIHIESQVNPSHNLQTNTKTNSGMYAFLFNDDEYDESKDGDFKPPSIEEEKQDRYEDDHDFERFIFNEAIIEQQQVSKIVVPLPPNVNNTASITSTRSSVFEGKVKNTEEFKNIFNGLKHLVPRCNIKVTQNGISIQAMDVSHISLVQLVLPRPCFRSYFFTQNLILGLNLFKLSEILSFAENQDEVSVICPQVNSDDITIKIDSGNNRVSEYGVLLVNFVQDEFAIPEIDYGVIFSVESSKFKNMCSELLKFGDVCEIRVSTRDGVVMSSNSREKGSKSISVVDKTSKNLSIKKPMRPLSFALRYLSMFCKSSSVSFQVKIFLSMDSPLKMEYQLENGGLLSYFLAPKIMEEDD